jgi:hypothetical protein
VKPTADYLAAKHLNETKKRNQNPPWSWASKLYAPKNLMPKLAPFSSYELPLEVERVVTVDYLAAKLTNTPTDCQDCIHSVGVCSRAWRAAQGYTVEWDAYGSTFFCSGYTAWPKK